MDVYSFGMIIWELFFECVPFDNSIIECVKNIVDNDTRPKIYVDDET